MSAVSEYVPDKRTIVGSRLCIRALVLLDFKFKITSGKHTNHVSYLNMT